MLVYHKIVYGTSIELQEHPWVWLFDSYRFALLIQKNEHRQDDWFYHHRIIHAL